MEMELYKIKQLMMSCAEVGAARVMQALSLKRICLHSDKHTPFSVSVILSSMAHLLMVRHGWRKW